MENAWEEILPKNHFQVGKSLPLGDRAQETLVHFYQPIIGASALALYFSLLGEIKWQFGLSEQTAHSELLADLNVGLQLFFEDRKKLEGIGLLRAYSKEDLQLGKVFLYILQEPLSPENFLKDPLLHFLIKEQLSEQKYEKLIQRFIPKEIDSAGFDEITKDFQEVYSFREERFSADYAEVAAVAENFDLAELPAIQQDGQLDWQLIEDNLKRLGVTAELTEAEQQEIFIYHIMYGLEEMELSEILAKTSNITENKISLKDFRKAVRQLFQKKVPVEVVETKKETPQTQLNEADQKTFRENSLRLDGFSEEDIQLIQEVESFAPMTYFQAIKEAKGGYVSNPETWVVRDLVDKSGLPKAVVNFLIHYVLVVKNSPVLNSSYVSTIANEWAQSGIHTPEAALKHARELNKKPKRQKNGRNTNRKVRREKVPEWMNKKSIPEAKIAPERQAELDEMLKDFLKEGDDRG